MQSMQPYTMLISLRRAKTRLQLTQGQQLMLRAYLPQPALFWTGKPVKALLESLAIWLDAKIHVVLDADDKADGFILELTDELGTGRHTPFYDVVECNVRRRRRRRSGQGGDALQREPTEGGQS